MSNESAAGLLVSEIHHRVMNSYQIISTLAERCGRVNDIADLPPIVDDLARRLSAFAAVHRQLATPPSGNFSDFCSRLGTNLVNAFGRHDAIHVRMEIVDLPGNWLSPIALIVAELLTNCLKHSLRSVASGSIYLEFRVASDRLLIEAHDSAAPQLTLPSDPSRIISALSASLGGEACVIDRNGYCAQVSLPLHARAICPSGAARRSNTIRSMAPSQHARPGWQGASPRTPLSQSVSSS